MKILLDNRKKYAINRQVEGKRIVVQPGRTLRSGRRGRWFESSHPDFARQSFSDGGLLFFYTRCS